MGLLDGFEKLINEHGSAAILKERIALANDKYSALEVEVKALRSANETLRLDNGKFIETIRVLEEKLSHNNDPLKFDEKTGTFISSADGLRYCAKCKAKNNLSPLKNGSYGWECPVCDSKFSDPARPRSIGVRSISRR